MFVCWYMLEMVIFRLFGIYILDFGIWLVDCVRLEWNLVLLLNKVNWMYVNRLMLCRLYIKFVFYILCVGWIWKKSYYISMWNFNLLVDYILCGVGSCYCLNILK